MSAPLNDFYEDDEPLEVILAIVNREPRPCPICSWLGGFHDDGPESPHLHLRWRDTSIAPVRLATVKMCNCGMPVSSAGAKTCRNPRHLEYARVTLLDEPRLRERS